MYEMPKCKQKWRMKNVIFMEKEDEETGFVAANVFVHTENNMRSLVWLWRCDYLKWQLNISSNDEYMHKMQ